MESARIKFNSGVKLASRSVLRVEAIPAGSLKKNIQTTSNHNFTIQFTNIRGLNSNLNAVHQHLERSKPQILVLGETQLSEMNSGSPHLNYPNYVIHDRFRLKGGICAYIRADVPCKRMMEFESNEYDILWLRTSANSSSRFICCIYRSPNATNFSKLFDHLTECVNSIQTNFPSCEISFLGDFNVHHKDWLKFSRATDAAGRAAKNFCDSCDLTQIINEPTRVPDNPTHSPHLLDLFITSNPLEYTSSVTSPLGNSDHSLVTLSLKSIPANSTKRIPPRRIWHFRSAQWDDLRIFYSSFPWGDYCFKNKDASQSAKSISEVIIMGMELFIPFKIFQKGGNSKPWFNVECSKAICAKNKAYTIWKNHQAPTELNNFRKARNLCHKVINEAKRSFDQRKCDQLATCPNGSRQFWSLAKAVGRNFVTSSFPPLNLPDGKMATTSFDKAKAFASLFASNSTIGDRVNNCDPPIPSYSSSFMKKIQFRTQQIKNIIKEMETHKSAGPDGIPPIVIKNCSPELSPILSRLYNLSFSTGTFPESWKLANVQPIPKKGDSSLPINYRPIAITSILSKIMEKSLNAQILTHLEHCGLLNDKQYGFRQARSTGDILSYVTHLWNKALEEKGETIAVALDISKAFDQVWHKNLFTKLPTFGLSPDLCLWIRNFLTDRKISVVVDGVSSDPHPINAGVPQGSVLSPTLFLMYINDLMGVTSNPIHCFADDTTLHAMRSGGASSMSSRQDVVSSINKDLINLEKWGSLNHVNFNSKKTQCCLVSRHKNLSCPPVTYSNNNLEFKDSLSVLGVTISSDLSWNNHISSIAKSAARKLGFLFRSRQYFSPQQLLTLYKAQIRPCLEYGCHLWRGASQHALSSLDAIQKRAVRLIDDESLTASLQSLDHRRRVSALTLFYRYYHGRCSAELKSIIPPKATFVRGTRESSSQHPDVVKIATNRTSQFQSSFVPMTSREWNNLPAAIFPKTYNLQTFKSNLNQYLLKSKIF